MRYVIVNIKGDIIEEFETIREAEECLEYLSKWHDDYNIEQINKSRNLIDKVTSEISDLENEDEEDMEQNFPKSEKIQ